MIIEFINVVHAGVISSAPSFSQIGLRILNFLLSIFSVIVIIMTLVSGIMYFFAAGDEGMMRKAKKSFQWGIVGAAVGVCGIIILRFVSGMLTGSGN